MTTDITELAQRMKAAAVRAKTATEEYASGHMSVSVCYAECEEFNRLTDGPDNILALVEALEKAQTINAAAEKLVRCKGRYHSEQNYRALAALFGVTTPDLPPLDSESSTVTVKLPKPHAHLIWIQAGHAPDDYWDDVAVSHSEKDRCCDGSERYPVYARWEIEEMLTVAGIKWEAE
ncbi:hypothetical protein PGN94_15225 [Klebsiella aerogenes]